MLENPNDKTKRVAVVGGGMMGISSALELSKNDTFDITLFEANKKLGGLSTYFETDRLSWDQYYHVVLSTDKEMLEFLENLGMHNDVFWRETKTGFYGSGRLVSMSSTMDFVKFPFMTLWQKFRMGLGIIYSSRLKDPSKLDKIYVRTWLTKVFGRRVYERIWEPLLRSKLGDARERTSAAFIWATITRLYGARGDSGNKVEKMGHVPGGYHAILKKAEKLLVKQGIDVRKQAAVKRVEKNTENGSFKLYTDDVEETFDYVLLTTPCPSILNFVKERQKHEYWQVMEKVNYLGVSCVVLILKRSLSPYYVINLLDKKLPFTGIIEVTNVISPKDVGDCHLVYLPKYTPEDDPATQLDDDELARQFVSHLKNVFPDLQDDEILDTLVFREKCVQPLQELHSMENKISFQTPIEGLFVSNTAMILNSTLNNNAVISMSRSTVKEIIERSQ